MRPRVCILCRENVLHWTPLYVEGFRQCADVITVGPALDEAFLAHFGLEQAVAHREPNNINTDTEDALEALSLLPEGWTPDLVVGLQSAAPDYRGIPGLACPTAYISVDTWHDQREFRVTRNYDHVFAAQRVFLPYLRAGGCRDVHWLPLACAPARHRPMPVEEQFDITFVGSLGLKVNEQRANRLVRLSREFSVGKQGGVGHDDMSATFCMGRLAFNSSIAEDVNMRVFEVMAMGRPLLTNRDARTNGLLDLFEDGKHLITYDDEDLIERARHYLDDPAARAAMGAAARELVLARHTYRHRAETVLETVFGPTGAPATPVPRGIRDGGRASAYLPHGVRTVVDVGAAMGQSKIALRRQGIDKLVGVAPDAATAGKRARSYDEMHTAPLPPETLAPVDAVVWTTPVRVEAEAAEAAAWAHAALVEGGTFVLCLGASAGFPRDHAAWDAWIYERGFHLMILRATGQSLYVCARKFTQSLHDITEDIYTRWPAPAVD